MDPQYKIWFVLFQKKLPICYENNHVTYDGQNLIRYSMIFSVKKNKNIQILISVILI